MPAQRISKLPGSIRNSSEKPTTPVIISTKFTSKERDAETGFDFFGARYLSGQQGRRTNVDPAFESEEVENPPSWNRYSYVYNRPLAFTDNDGRCPQCLPALAVGAAGAAVAAGTTAFTEWYNTGDVRGRDVWAAAAGSFVSGSVASLTLGVSALAEAGLGTTVLVGAGSNVLGGVEYRYYELTL
jgi:RHS repeat-associated protein